MASRVTSQSVWISYFVLLETLIVTRLLKKLPILLPATESCDSSLLFKIFPHHPLCCAAYPAHLIILDFVTLYLTLSLSVPCSQSS